MLINAALTLSNTGPCEYMRSVCRSKIDIKLVPLYHLSILWFKAGSLTESGACHFDLTGNSKPQESSTPPALQLQIVTLCPALLVTQAHSLMVAQQVLDSRRHLPVTFSETREVCSVMLFPILMIFDVFFLLDFLISLARDLLNFLVFIHSTFIAVLKIESLFIL